MKRVLLSLMCAGVMALSACETDGGGYASGGGGGGMHLSGCGRNALIGAGIGAAIGATQGPHENRAENAALGAAIGGAGTYGVCRWLSAREQERVQNSYYQALNSGGPVNDSWQSDDGKSRSLSVSQPMPADGYGAQCRRVSGTVSDPQYGDQPLPPETFCRDSSGRWVPA